MEGKGSPTVMRLALFQYCELPYSNLQASTSSGRVSAINLDALDIYAWGLSQIGPNNHTMITSQSLTTNVEAVH